MALDGVKSNLQLNNLSSSSVDLFDIMCLSGPSCALYTVSEVKPCRGSYLKYKDVSNEAKFSEIFTETS